MKTPEDPKSAENTGRDGSEAEARATSGEEAGSGATSAEAGGAGAASKGKGRSRAASRSGGDSGDRARTPLAELGIGAAWLVGLAAASQIVGLAFATNPMAAIVVQAVVVDLATGKAGVKWDPRGDEKGANETKDALRGIGIGAAVALVIAAAVVGGSAALGWAKVSAHAPNTTLGLGLIRAAAFGVRDTLLYAGLPLYFLGRAGAPKVAAVVFGALAAGAALCLHPAAGPEKVVLAASVLLAGAALWARDGTGWRAAGVVGGWVLFAGAMFGGGLFDVVWKKGALAPGLAADGAPAWAAAGLFAAVAVAALGAGKGRAASPRKAARADGAAESGAAAETAAPPTKPAAEDPE